MPPLRSALSGSPTTTLRHIAGLLVIDVVGGDVASKLLRIRNVSATANVYNRMLDHDWEE